MNGVNNSLGLAESDAFAEVLSAEPCHIVLETSPPDYVNQISGYLSSVDRSRQDKVTDDPPEAAESDSGDSLFITQNPVPEAVRSRRRRHHTFNSDLTSPREREEGEDDSASSASQNESKRSKERKRKLRLPRLSFPFLSGIQYDTQLPRRMRRKPRGTLLSAEQNTELLNYAMGGFFKSIRERVDDRVDDLESPRLYMDNEEDISPLSEEEGSSDGEDIKVVERKLFVVSSKPKCPQPWYTPSIPKERDNINLNQEKRQRPGRADKKISQRGQQRNRKTSQRSVSKLPSLRKTQLSSETESSDDGDSPHRCLVKRKLSDNNVTSDRITMDQSKTPKAKRCEKDTRRNEEKLSCHQTGEEEPFKDSSAPLSTVRELYRPRRASVDYRQEDREKKSKKNRRIENGDHGEIEEGMEMFSKQETPAAQHIGASENVEEKETPSLSDGERTEPLALFSTDKSEFSERSWKKDLLLHDDSTQGERCLDDSMTQRKRKEKKKREKNDVTVKEGPEQMNESKMGPYMSDRPPECSFDKINVENGENVRQEDQDGSLESDVRTEENSVSLLSCEVVNDGREKRTKKRKRASKDDDAERSPACNRTLNDDDIEIRRRKKKKRKKEKRFVVTEEWENQGTLNMSLDSPQRLTGLLEESDPAVSQEISESINVKNSRQSTGSCVSQHEDLMELRKKHKKKQRSSFNDATKDGEETVDVDLTIAGSTAMSVKKKKKKKISNICTSEETLISNSPEETGTDTKDTNADKIKEMTERLTEQDADLVTKKKKKKRKEKFTRDVSEDTVAQSDDSVSVQEKEMKRTTSVSAADTVEKDATIHQEKSVPWQSLAVYTWEVDVSTCEIQSAEIATQCNDKVKERKKKRKRKSSAAQDNDFKDHKEDFKELSEMSQRALPQVSELLWNEIADIGAKKKKKKERKLETNMVGLDSAADLGRQSDDAVILKKKKKKKSKGDSFFVIKFSVSDRSTLSRDKSRRKKSRRSDFPLDPETKNSPSAEICHDSNNSDEVVKESLMENAVLETEPALASSTSSTNAAFNDMKVTKKKKCTDDVLLEESLLLNKEKNNRNEQLAVLNVMPQRISPSHSHMLSSSNHIKKNKHKKCKRRLHNPRQDFLDKVV